MEFDVTLNTRLLPALVLLMLVLELISPYRGWMTLLVGLGGALLTSYLWARALANGLRFTRAMRFGWAQVGDCVEERFTLVNETVLPALWVEVVDHSTMPGYRVERVATLGGQDEGRWRMKGTCMQRGLFTLGPTSLRTGDPLGVFTVELRYPQSVPFMVMPPIVSLPQIEVAAGGRAGEGRPRPNAMERTVSAATVREYVPGDSRRWIHWRTSARRDSLYVKLFESVPAGDWWILLDLDWEEQVGEGMAATEEHGVILAASLADRGLRAGKAVGLVTHGAELVWLRPQGGEGRRWEILRALAQVSVGERSLSQLLTQIGPALGRYASLIIITPAVGGEWVESLVPLIRRDIVPTVMLLDRASFGRAQDRPFGRAQDRPFGRAQDRPFGRAQDRPFDRALDRPLDGAQDQALGGEGDVRKTAAVLAELGVVCHVISRDLLDPAEMQPGKRGHWEWRVLGTGHAVPVRKPQDTAWRTLV